MKTKIVVAILMSAFSVVLVCVHPKPVNVAAQRKELPCPPACSERQDLAMLKHGRFGHSID